VIAHDEATRNVTRLQGNLTRGRLPRRERREKEAELARWRIRAAAAAKTLADIRMPQQRQLDRDEGKLGADLAGLHGQRNDRADWFARHPEAARRLDGIEREVETLNVGADRSGIAVNRGRDAWRDWPWLRETPVRDRGLDMGLGR
jgi:hypothetical protein